MDQHEFRILGLDTSFIRSEEHDIAETTNQSVDCIPGEVRRSPSRAAHSSADEAGERPLS